MTVSKRPLLLVAFLCAATAWGQQRQREPHIGYIYPCGGQRNTVFEILVGGQSLNGTGDVHISGEGVHAKVIQHYRPIKNLQKEQRDELQRQMRELTQKRLAEAGIETRNQTAPRQEPARKKQRKPGGAKRDETTENKPVKLPEHPLLRNMESKSLRELYQIREMFFNARKRQPNAQIGETVLIEITIDTDAEPGDRELRLMTPFGLSNPMCFQVGLMPETREQEPNDPNVETRLPPEPPLDLPILMNGQIEPGDVDRFRFRAKKGQQLVIEVQARHLIPYLADAVPGWFQATLTLYDGEGNELAFTDDYHFDPDPVLFYRVPADGEYELEIRDSIYRGREDFVYRVAVGEQPFITQTFPLGARTGAKKVVMIDGWNLPGKRLTLDNRPGADTIRHTELRRSRQMSNLVTYAVDALPEGGETEPNNTLEAAQSVKLPRTVNGRIDEPGDVDIFAFEGSARDEFVAEVFGRRLHSPIDSLLRLTDASGAVLEWNDDHDDGESGLLTHHADSYLRAQLPRDGVYYIHLADSQSHGGKAYAYRLRLGPPRHDFTLRVTPSSLNMRKSAAVPIDVHVVRKDGFEGDINVVLKDAPAGFSLSGNRVPGHRDRIRMTLTAPRTPAREPVTLELEGRAEINGKTVVRSAVPAEDMMQAFLYRHLTPSQSLMVAVKGAKSVPPMELAEAGPVRVPAGGSARVRIKTPKRPALAQVSLELREPRAGMSLQDVTVEPDGLAFVLEADKDSVEVGLVDNLIVEAFVRTEAQPQGEKARKGQTGQGRFSLGVLPAIPFEIVRK